MKRRDSNPGLQDATNPREPSSSRLVIERLEKLRARLLDLTNRNRLLNFKHSSSSTLRFVETGLDDTFQALLDGSSLTFEAVPEPPAGPRVADAPSADTPKRSAAEHAASLGWNTSFDLPRKGSSNTRASILRVLQYPVVLEATTRKIASAARTTIEESGTNTLHLTHGFLEWYESEDSDTARLAPLLSVPVAIERPSRKSGAIEARLEYSGEDLGQNLSLIEKMRRDFGLELPQFDDDELPSSYFRRIEAAIAKQRRWRVRTHLSLALLSFGKLLMYRDLDRKAWPEVATHPVVKTLFEGPSEETPYSADETYNIDAPQIAKQLPPLVVDADSSQHTALADVAKGRNLVIEGPPGTGKSQTITNLIAAAMHRGQSVLFVSEKLAALQVVRRRLDAVGLGAFCLELHSHKTRKDALLQDLAGRLKVKGSFRSPGALERLSAELGRKRDQLNRYVALMNHSVEPLGLSLFQILWRRDWAMQGASWNAQQLDEIRLESVLGMDQAKFEGAEELVRQFAIHFGEVADSCAIPAQHPWAWVSADLDFEGQGRLLDDLRELSDLSDAVVEHCRGIHHTTGIQINATIDGLKNVSEVLALLPKDGWDDDGQFIAACRDKQMRDLLAQLRSLLSQTADARKPLDGVVAGSQNPLLSRRELDVIAAAVETLVQAGETTVPVNAIRGLSEQVKATSGNLDRAGKAMSSLANAFGCEVPFDSRGLSQLLAACALADEAPVDVLALGQMPLANEGARARLGKASIAAAALREQRSDLSKRIRLADIDGERQLEEAEQALRAVEDAAWWQTLFGSDFRRAKRLHRRLQVEPTRVSRAEMAADLRSAVTHRRACVKFETDERIRELGTEEFEGIDTPWHELERVADWYDKVKSQLPESDAVAAALRSRLVNGRLSEQRALRMRLVQLDAERRLLTNLHQVVSREPSGASVSTAVRFADLQDRYQARWTLLNSVVLAVGDTVFKDGLTVAELGGVVPLAQKHLELRAQLDALIAQNGVVAQWSSMAPERLERLGEAARLVEALDGHATAPDGLFDWLVSENFASRLTDVRRRVAEQATIRKRWSATLARLRASSGDETLFQDAGELVAVSAEARRRCEQRETLPAWLHYRRRRRQCVRRGLSKLVALAEAGACRANDLPQAFRFVAYNSLAQQQFADSPELHQFSGVSHERVRQEFARLDSEVICQQREQIASEIDRRRVPVGIGGGPVSSWTELALIYREIEKQKRHIPIRQLVSRAGAALQALKPCFMMGPLSVAQYLPTDGVKFDLIVMDEASQLKPEDAIGAIARAGQMVVVGDPKQLPPTNFFDRLIADEELNDDDVTTPEEVESILDAASAVYRPARRLRWHYRSQHHSLIAYSNKAFYDNDLVVFPSSFQDSPDLGVKYHQIGGIYDSRRNVIEAEAIVDAVLRHMTERPHETLGVVTLNFEQQELVEELLERRLRLDPFGLEYRARAESETEPFFVKNLENVQGDERDVIFISATYGPDARGNQFQRFGPINRKDGHRRLNVLFTRARKRTEVFCSLDPGRLLPAADGGVKVLKEYLEYAKTGVLDVSDGNRGPTPANEFEQSVQEAIKAGGYEAVPQVGVAGFFIDLGVRHPTRPGAFVLGVECDGATYHSARSARDRDRLRQEILENQGWKVYRIWSTDWFRSRERETEKLLRRLAEILAGDGAHQAELERQRQYVSVRKRLERLRDDEIAPAYPQQWDQIGFLRLAMLEELLRKRPRTKNEFLARIAGPLREQTGPGQIGAYLERVLEILRDSGE